MAKISKKEKIKSAKNPPPLKIKLKSPDEVSDFAENIINTVREPLLVLDKDLRVVKASRSFYDFFKVTSVETIGTLIYDLGNRQWNIPKLRELLETILPEKTTFDNYEVEHDFSTIGKRIMLLNARQIKRAVGKEKIILLAVEDITERKIAEKSVSETSRMTDEYLDILFNHAHEPIIIWDASFVITHINHAFEKLSGYDWAEVRDKKIDILFPKDKIDSTLELIKNTLLNDEIPELIEIDILTKDNDIRTVLWNSANILDKEGKNIVATIAQDITNRKRTEEALLESEAKYRTLVTQSPDGIFVVDLSGTFLSVNKSMCDNLKYTKEELLSMKIWDIVPQQFLSLHRNRLAAIMKGEINEAAEYEVIGKDGIVHYIEVQSSPYYKDNKIIGFQGIARDITERKRAEEALRKTEKKFQLLFEQNLVGVYHTTLEGDILDCNDAFINMLGYDSLEELRAHKAVDFYHTETVRNNFVSRLRTEGFVKNSEISLIQKNGTTLFGLENATLTTGDKDTPTTILGTIVDITERKQAEEAVQRSELRFRTLYENAKIGLYRTTPDGTILMANKALVKMLGYPSFEKIVERNLEKDGYEPTYQRKEFLEKIEKDGEVNDFESAWVRLDGSVFFGRESAQAIRDSQGTTLYYDGMVEDITERKRMEKVIQESEERFRMVFENVLDGISIYNEDPDPSKRRLIECNERYATMAGRSRDELLQLGNTRGLQIMFEDKAENNRLESLDRGTAFLGSFSWIRPDGKENIIEYVGTPVTWRGKSYTIGIDRDITERKRAEEALHEREQLFRGLFNASPDAIVLIDPHNPTISWPIVDCNEATCQMSGYTREELIGQSIDVLNTTMGTPEERIAYFINLRQKEITHVETTHRHKDGHIFPVEVSTSIVTIGEHEMVLGIDRDITERKRAEELQAKERNLLQTLINNIPDYIYVKDIKGRFILGNTAVVHQMGLKTLDELVGKTDFDFFPSDLAEQYYAGEQKIIQSGKGLYNFEGPTQDMGKQKWVSTTKVLLRDAQGNIVGFVGLGHDMTERKRAEEEITMLAHSLRSINECVSITDLKDKILFVNESYLKTYGYDKNELIGKHISIVRSQNNPPELVKEILPSTLEGGWQGELWNKRKDGSEFLIHLSTTVINDKDGKAFGLIGVAKDITELKHSERELIEAKEKAEQSDKLKSEFLAQMSHEIRTPLNAIVGNVDYLNELFGKKIDSDARDCFDGIDLASKRIIRTVDLILNAAELQTSGYKPQFVTVDLNSGVLEELYLEHQLSAKQKGLEIIYTCKEKDTKVIADEYSITQIFANLIDNAIKYTKEGKVEILLGKNKTGNMMAEVKDTGIGISKEFLPRIFEPFIQEDQGFTRSFEGNGLGLVLVKGYCELNNAIIEVESEKNVGSTFRIIFNKKVTEAYK